MSTTDTGGLARAIAAVAVTASLAPVLPSQTGVDACSTLCAYTRIWACCSRQTARRRARGMPHAEAVNYFHGIRPILPRRLGVRIDAVGGLHFRTCRGNRRNAQSAGCPMDEQQGREPVARCSLIGPHDARRGS